MQTHLQLQELRARILQLSAVCSDSESVIEGVTVSFTS